MDIIDKMNGVIESDEIVGANDVFAFFLLPSLIYNAIPGFPARMTVAEETTCITRVVVRLIGGRWRSVTTLLPVSVYPFLEPKGQTARQCRSGSGRLSQESPVDILISR